MARDPETIEREIEQARDALAESLDVLSDRASPKRLVDAGRQSVQARLAGPADPLRADRRRRADRARGAAQDVPLTALRPRQRRVSVAARAPARSARVAPAATSAR